MKNSNSSMRIAIYLLITLALAAMLYFNDRSADSGSESAVRNKAKKTTRVSKKKTSSDKVRTHSSAGGFSSGGSSFTQGEKQEAVKRKSLLRGGAVTGQTAASSHWSRQSTEEENEDPAHQDIVIPKGYDPGMLQKELEYVLEMEDATERRQSLADLGKLMSQEYMDLALEFLGQLQDKNEKVVFAKSIVSSMVFKDPALTAQWAGETPLDIQKNISGQIAINWAKRDIDQAVVWAEQLGEKDLKSDAYGSIATVMAEMDMQAAYNWAAKTNDADLSNIIFTRMGLVLAKDDPQAAVDWAMEFSDEKTKQDILFPAVRIWSNKDVSSAASWAEELPESSLKSKAAKDIATIWGKKDPVQAVTWASSLTDLGSRTSAVASGVYQWANKDPAAAFTWAEGLPSEDNVKNMAIYSIVKVWAVKDSKKAEEVANTFDDPQLKEQMLQIIETNRKKKN